MTRSDIRFALPSKGRLEPESLAFLTACGLGIYKPNPRQYQATIPAVPHLSVLFQRPGDIVVGVRQGSLDFGITGLDMVEEKRINGEIVMLHEALGFGHCSLAIAVPEKLRDLLETHREDLRALLIVSDVRIVDEQAIGEAYRSADIAGLVVGVSRAKGEKCHRCWIYSETVGTSAGHPALCERCLGNL
jgi:ATP phosphoribosyltransferase